MAVECISPDILIQNYKEVYLFIGVYFCKEEIKSYLVDRGFSEDFILTCQFDNHFDEERQYFDFINYLPSNGIFIDAGAFHGETTIRFVEYSRKNYSKIFAFEPDKKNLQVAKQNIKKKGIKDVEFFSSGLWSHSSVQKFNACASYQSAVCDDGEDTIELVCLDDIIKEGDFVSFIKMDIEGSELKALQGAKNIITMHKPMCAISVYHKPGDVMAIMCYLHELVPQYKFAIRHYSTIDTETVLYAFV